MSAARVAVIGLGRMGGPIADRIIDAGHDVAVFDIAADAVAARVERGARGARSAADAARDAEFLQLVVFDDDQAVSSLTSPEGALDALAGNAVVSIHTTVSLDTIDALATCAEARGVTVIDAGISGGEKGAVEATLSIMVGGETDVFQQALPMFQIMGKTIVHVGSYGAGQVVKACNQVMVAMQMQAMAEALVLGTKAGVDPAKIIDVLTAGYAQCRVMQVRGPEILKRNFKPGFKTDFHYKDLNIALATGAEYGVPLPGTAMVQELFKAMRVAGRGDLDHSAIITILEDLARVEVKST